MDKALVFDTKDCRLESCQDHLTPVSFGPDGHLFEASNAAQGTEPQARDHGQPSSGPMGLRVSWRRVGHSVLAGVYARSCMYALTMCLLLSSS